MIKNHPDPASQRITGTISHTIERAYRHHLTKIYHLARIPSNFARYTKLLCFRNTP